MADILDNAAHLAQTIGARPAGTEEERQAALYLSEAFQRKAGLPTEVEDFTCPTDFELPRAILCILAVVLTALTFFIPVLVVVAFIVTLLLAALYAVETLVRPVLARALSHGASQNVVAKFEPAPKGDARAARQRKVVLVAHYDTGKVRAELQPALMPLMPILQWATVGGMVVLALMLLVRMVSMPTGPFAVVVTVLSALACVACLLPVVSFALHRSAPYNEGANCNAAGVAVLLEVAQRVRKGHARAEEMRAMEVRVHGEQAARERGLVPEGAALVYETEAQEAAASAEDRLMAAKAAVAMLTGKPVSATVNIDLAEEEGPADERPMVEQDAEALAAEAAQLQADAQLVEEAAEALAPAEEPAAFDPSENTVEEQPVTFSLGGGPTVTLRDAAPAPAPAPPAPAAQPSSHDDDVPDWFKAARAKARKNVGSRPTPSVTRSRYAEAAATAQEAIDARNAAQEAADAAASERRAMTETEARLAQVHATLLEQHPVRTPGSHAQVAPAAPAGEAGQAEGREEVRTVAFAPVEINGDELKREAQKQREGDQVATVAADGPVAEPALEAAAPAPEATLTTPPAAAPAPAAAADGATAAALTPAEPAPAPSAGPAAEQPTAGPAPEPAPAERPAASPEAAARIDNLRKSIPLVGGASAKREEASAEQKARQNALRQVLPSLSGSIKASPDLFAKEEKPADALGSEKTDAFAPIGATTAFQPVTGATAELLDDEEIIEDADDSSYDGQLTETGAYTGGEYVEMPEGRAARLFGKFRRGKKDKKVRAAAEPSTREWLDIDEDYDARTKGEELGPWGSRDEGGFAEFDDYDDYDDYDDFEEEDDSFSDAGFRPRSWQGGVFSRESLEKVRGKLQRGGKGDEPAADHEEALFEPEVGEADPEGERPARQRRKRRAAGVDALFADTTAGVPEDQVPVDSMEPEEPLAPAADPKASPFAEVAASLDATSPALEPLDDVQAVHDFRLPDIGVEVWFVALGAELAANGGIKDFLTSHRDELKGAIFIDIEALGAGTLTSIGHEGTYFPVKPSSRMGRYVRKASAALGMHVAEGSMLWRDSAAAVALRQGCQAMHFAGMEGDKPAHAASKDDVMANVSEDVMLANADFIVEVLKSI